MLYRKQAKSVKPLGEKKGSNSDEKPKCKRQKLPWKIDVIVTFESRKSFKITLCIYESIFKVEQVIDYSVRIRKHVISI